ncbi:DNA primase [Halovenus sp. WSH3]|uniref:DNA primase DnaG n=1 Tax=Halovenus carboxidivorans TaxID=2692199 RepID=A0A6B0TAG2_9EURY|nr:DNA primase DnaG [Halovenus carboxidivorans]MXR52362.1 DNA primase [Halovenus carboxidivorans]
MPHSAKYVIHADIRTSGVVERSDVVGAIFGQTEGLLGEDMDLRDLQDASKVGRIDVDIESEGGRSFGTIQIASGMDRAETAVLAAALETIERVGPCRASCSIIKIEDARAAKRREIVDRATELLAAFEDEQLTSERLVEEVRERVRESELTEYRGFPAGPRVADSDAIIVVEGRADVRKLLSVGIKNAIAVEGTDVPEEIARLTQDRTTTAFLDGDRGGDLILRELAQVGNVDYVAFAPHDRSVEDLDRAAVMAALRKKLPYEQVEEGNTPREAFAPTDGGTVPEDPPAGADASAGADPAPATGPDDADGSEPDREAVTPSPSTDGHSSGPAESTAEEPTPDSSSEESEREPTTLAGHVEAVIEDGAGTVRLLDSEFAIRAESDAESAFETIEDAEDAPHTVVLDGTATQRLLDISAQRGVGQIIAAETGEFVKQPASVRVHAAEEIDLS